MTDQIQVRCERVPGGHRCTVVVGDDPRATTHEVRVDDATLRQLAPAADPADGPAADPADGGTAGAEALVAASFAFLLEREPRESILRTFDLPVIERYFPGYAREIAPRVARHLKGEGQEPDRA